MQNKSLALHLKSYSGDIRQIDVFNHVTLTLI